MRTLAVLEAFGLDAPVETLLYYAILYFLVVHVLFGLAGEVVRALIRWLARAIVAQVRNAVRGNGRATGGV